MVEAGLTAVEVNDLIPRVSELEADLAAHGLFPASHFGSSSVNGGIPDPLVITFGDGVDVFILRRVILSSIPFGLKAVRKAVGVMHAYRIYVGSYSYETEPISRVMSVAELTALAEHESLDSLAGEVDVESE